MVQYIICSLTFIILSFILLYKILKCRNLIENAIYFDLIFLITSLLFIMYGNYEGRIIYMYIGMAIILSNSIILFFYLDIYVRRKYYDICYGGCIKEYFSTGKYIWNN